MKKMNVFRRVITAITTAIMTVSASGLAFNTSATNEEPNFDEMADRIVYLVNEARAEAGLEPIYMVPYLRERATLRAEECTEVFSHSRSNGDSYSTVVDYNSAPWQKISENIAAGMNTPEATFEQWKNSPSHWAAIMNPEYTHMGVGIAYDADSTYKWYWQQLFIKIDTEERPDGSMDGQYIPDQYTIIPQATGDIDGDGVIDSFDYVLLCRYLNKQVTLNPLQVESADILQDGVISYSDAAFLRKYILGQINEVPVKLF